MTSLDDAIDKKVGEVRTDNLDISYGEVMSLLRSKEIQIDPDFQRLFRWEEERSSRLVESILLMLPVPPVFFMERVDGVLELVDGLQRISSVAYFLDHEVIQKPSPLVLAGCDIVPEFNGMRFENLSIALRMRIKRAPLRAIIIKKQSSTFLRYEMFKRLNTGGMDLSEQEIRNCQARMAGEDGAKFYNFLMKCSTHPSFVDCVSSLSEAEIEKRGGEELVLRFFALKNGFDDFKGSVREWLTTYMENVIFRKSNYKDSPFDETLEFKVFESAFDLLQRSLGDSPFVRFKGAKATGGLAPAHFEAVTMGVVQTLETIKNLSAEAIRNCITQVVQDADFKAFVGPGSNSLVKLKGRIRVVENALRNIPQ